MRACGEIYEACSVQTEEQEMEKTRFTHLTRTRAAELRDRIKYLRERELQMT